MRLMLDGENDDDVVWDADVGSSVDGGSVDGGNDPHGLQFFAVTAAAIALLADSLS